MPFYDYICKECSTTTQVRISMEKKENGFSVTCPACNSKNTEQVFTSVSIIGKSSQTKECTSMPGMACPSSAPGCGCPGGF